MISSFVNFFLYGGIVLAAVGIYQYNALELNSGLEKAFGGTSLVVLMLIVKGILFVLAKAWAGVSSVGSSQASRDMRNFVSGGNEKLASERMADMFFRHRGDYVATFNEQCMRMASTADRANNADYINLIRENAVPNLTELIILDLHAFSAPVGTLLMYTKTDFRSKVAKFLRDRGVPEQFVSGDNRQMTAAI